MTAAMPGMNFTHNMSTDYHLKENVQINLKNSGIPIEGEVVIWARIIPPFDVVGKNR